MGRCMLENGDSFPSAVVLVVRVRGLEKLPLGSSTTSIFRQRRNRFCNEWTQQTQATTKLASEAEIALYCRF
jgi:hypothetical protein